MLDEPRAKNGMYRKNVKRGEECIQSSLLVGNFVKSLCDFFSNFTFFDFFVNAFRHSLESINCSPPRTRDHSCAVVIPSMQNTYINILTSVTDYNNKQKTTPLRTSSVKLLPDPKRAS